MVGLYVFVALVVVVEVEVIVVWVAALTGVRLRLLRSMELFDRLMRAL